MEHTSNRDITETKSDRICLLRLLYMFRVLPLTPDQSPPPPTPRSLNNRAESLRSSIESQGDDGDGRLMSHDGSGRSRDACFPSLLAPNVPRSFVSELRSLPRVIKTSTSFSLCVEMWSRFSLFFYLFRILWRGN